MPVLSTHSAYQYTYNADGEETSQADVGSPDLPTVTLTYDYDADGNRTAMDDSLGGLVSYTYNARDELTNETLSGTDISAIAMANTYDNTGNMTGQTRYSNTAETDVVATTSYTYDSRYAYCSPCRKRYRSSGPALMLKLRTEFPGFLYTCSDTHQNLASWCPVDLGRHAA
jgi:YD repeat-containing protein